MSWKRALATLAEFDTELPVVLAHCRKLRAHRPNLRVVDVGAGHGRILLPLRAAGFAATGVEVNPALRTRLASQGARALSPAEFLAEKTETDLLIASHIIEHFAPEALRDFLDSYLDRLATGGHLLVATPLLSPFFFDDFDHVKPYHPEGLRMFFGEGSDQMQFQSRHRMRLTALWFRRSPWQFKFARGNYVRTWYTPVFRLANLASALAFRATGGRIGPATGWIGLFEKL